MKRRLFILLTIFSASQFAFGQKVRISASRDTLYAGDILTLKFSLPHGGDFAVKDPEGTLFFPLVLPETFRGMRAYTVKTDTLTARPFIHDIDGLWSVFSHTGKYVFMLSENLETDDGTPVFKKTIYFINKRK